jgi:hypothetical protein
MRLKLLLAMLTISGAVLAQDTVRTLVITEAKMDRNETSYMELTNMGTTTLNLSDFRVGRLSPWDAPNDPGWPEARDGMDDNTIERLPDVDLAPGESYVIGVVCDFEEEQYALQVAKFGFSPDWSEFFTSPAWWKLIDLQVHKIESTRNDPTDSVSRVAGDPLKTFHYWGETWSGRDCWYVMYFDSPNDSAVVDQVGGLFTDGDGTNPDGGMQDVAGVTGASGTHYMMRRHSVTQGNTTWVRGLDYDDSEWIPVPFMGPDQYWERLRGPFWTVGNHVNATLDATTLQPIAGSPVTVNFDDQIINVPWGVRNNDSVMFQFEYTPGLAWHYDYNRVHEDSAYNSAQTGDTLTIYACGDMVTIMDFRIEVAAAGTDEARVVPMYHPNANGDYRNTLNPYFRVSDGVPGMDTIRNIPFACREDSLMLYLELPEGATYAIDPVDGQDRTDLKDGDLLVITSSDASATKSYYLKLQKYRKARNAELSAIRWPDIPEVFVGSIWDSDTIPGFDRGLFNYALELPPGVTQIPGLVAKNLDDNARHEVTRAISLKGSVEDRTVTFTSWAEDDTTWRKYKVTLNLPVDPQYIQPWIGKPFISELSYRDTWANTFLEVVNPGTELMDMSHFMFAFTSINDPALVISNNEDDYDTPELYFMNRYMKYIPGRIWADTATWAANPGTVDADPDSNVDPVVYPGETFVIADIISTSQAYNVYPVGEWTAEENANINFGWGGDNGQHPCPWAEPPPNSGDYNNPVIGWHQTKWYLFEIIGEGGDSVRDGTKPATDPNDFVLLDVFGGSSSEDPAVIGGVTIDQVMGFTRKPEIYKGNPIYGDLPGGSFGTDPNSSEWLRTDRNYFNNRGIWWPRDVVAQTEGIGQHFMYPVTVGISTVNSYMLKVSPGYSDSETIEGVKQGATVDQFLAKVIKKHVDQTWEVMSGGTEITGATEVTNGDVLVVHSADLSNTTQYTIEVTPDGTLSSDAVLTSSTLTIVATEPASVSGFELGTTVAEVVDAVVVPDGADMDIIDAAGAYVPTKTINFDTIPVQVLATDNVYFEVMAEDGETVITYQLQPTSDASAAYVTSTVYDVDQESLLISLIPKGSSVQAFLSNLVPASGASMVLLDKLGFERSTGEVIQDDRLVVTAEDGVTTQTYYLSLLEEVANYLAYVVSDVYTVDQEAKTITGTGITGTLSVTDFMGNLTAAEGASLEVQDNTGTAKAGADMLADEDMLEVVAGNGVNKATYSIILDHTGIVDDETALRIYPNPSTGLLYVEGAEPGSRIHVYNSVGIVLYDMPVFGYTEVISLEGQPDGLYFITVENGGEVSSRYKLIKQ